MIENNYQKAILPTEEVTEYSILYNKYLKQAKEK